jgi:hypothetical protein
MNILQNKLLEKFGLEGCPLVVSKCKCLADVLLPSSSSGSRGHSDPVVNVQDILAQFGCCSKKL